MVEKWKILGLFLKACVKTVSCLEECKSLHFRVLGISYPGDDPSSPRHAYIMFTYRVDLISTLLC